MARSDRREIRNRLTVLLDSSAEVRGAADKALPQAGLERSPSSAIGIAELIEDSPSLSDYPAGIVLDRYYPTARRNAARQMRVR